MTKSSEKMGKVNSCIHSNIQDIKSGKLWRAVAAEFLGTFMLCTWVIGSALHHKDAPPPPLLNIALCSAFIVASLITILSNVSGGHINPAISIGFLVTGQMTSVRFLLYVIVQCVGVVVSLMILRHMVPLEMLGTMGPVTPGPGVTPIMAVSCEFFLGFLLLFGTMAMTDSKRTDVKGSVPLFVGLIVACNILFGAGISGGSMNPALSLGPALLSGNIRLQWMYWLGPLLGGACGALTYDKIFSVTAVATPLFSCCKFGSFGSDTTRNKLENEIMLQENLV